MKKLIRDRINESIEDKSLLSSVSGDDHKKALINKLKEETNELNTELRGSNKAAIQEEMADVLEVLSCVVEVWDLSNEEIFQIADKKRNEKGSFLNGSMLNVTKGK